MIKYDVIVRERERNQTKKKEAFEKTIQLCEIPPVLGSYVGIKKIYVFRLVNCVVLLTRYS